MKTVAIIGGGPGGLLIARYLQQNSIPVTVYEGEASRNSRLQGGTLDLHAESGLLALKETGLMDKFNEFARNEGQEMKIYKGDTGDLLYEDGGEAQEGDDAYRPEIDRAQLRDIYLNALDKDTIKWNHRFTSATPLDGGSKGFTLNFSNAESVHTDILIGADGCWSKVRPLLTPAVPKYTGVTFIDLTIPKTPPHLSKLVGAGSAFFLYDTKALLPQMNSNGVMRVYLALKVPEDYFTLHPIPTTNDLETKEYIINTFLQGWNKDVVELVRATAGGDTVLTRKIYALPPDLKWDAQTENVAILGDAAHVMAPSGEGVNQAMLDALNLGKLLVPCLKSSVPVSPAMREYEKEMWVRALDEGQMSIKMAQLFHCDNAAEDFTAWFKGMMEMAGADQGGGEHEDAP